MIDYSVFKLKPEIKDELLKLELDFVFQPVYYPDGQKIYAYEAFMRPVGKSARELIDEYSQMGKLHVIEVATFFGAMKEYDERGYKEQICISSFPSESFTDAENREFVRYFKKHRGKGIVKILEYPEIEFNKWEKKSRALKRRNVDVSLNNFSIGNNDFEAMGIFKPSVVKIGRELIADIHKDENRQVALLRCIQKFHDLGAQVIAGGIECQEELDFLIPNGADYIQGFFLSEPK